MLQLSPQAIDHLLRVRSQKGLDATAIPRFVRKAGRIGLTFARGPESGDMLVDDGRMSTLIASSAADLVDATIDVRTEDDRSVLVVRRRRPAGTRPVETH